MSRRTVAVIQARMGSSRFPGKVLADIAGRPMLSHVLERVSLMEGLDAVWLATTTLPADEPLLMLARAHHISEFVGAVDDVLDRYYQAARAAKADVIVRVCADSPLFDPAIGGAVVAEFHRHAADYASNVHPPTYPEGLNVEVMSMAALERAWREASLPSEREHVTPYLWKHPERFTQVNLAHAVDWSVVRLVVDEPRDLQLVRAVYARLAVPGRPPFGLQEIMDVLERDPALMELNAGIPRNAGYVKSLRAEAGVWSPTGQPVARSAGSRKRV